MLILYDYLYYDYFVKKWNFVGLWKLNKILTLFLKYREVQNVISFHEKLFLKSIVCFVNC